MNNLIIIPARAGSKGIKNKNIIEINNKPLICYTIKVALEIKALGFAQNVVVSTDSEKISKISLEHGANVPFLRPENLAQDNSKSIDLITHLLEFYNKINIYYDNVILLQPTSPLREVIDLKNAINKFYKSSSDSLISCYEEEYISDDVIYYSKDNKYFPKSKDHNSGKRRQENSLTLVRNGAVYITKVKYLEEYNKIISDYPEIYIMPKERSINLDSKFDLEILKCLMKK